MATYAVNGDTLTGIADAIRAKTGSDEQMTVAAMAAAIEGIPTGGGERDTLVVEYDLIEDFTSTSNTALAVFDSVEVGAFFERHHGRRGSSDKLGAASIYKLTMESDVVQTSDNSAGYAFAIFIVKHGINTASVQLSGGALRGSDMSVLVPVSYSIHPEPSLTANCANPSGWTLTLRAQCHTANNRRIVNAGHYTFTITHLQDV